MRRHIAIVCGAFFIFCGCGRDDEIMHASKIMDSYYSSIRSGKIEDTIPLLTDDFIQKNPKENWVETQNGILSLMGPLVEWKRSTENSHYYPDTGQNQETVVIIYHVQYAHHRSRELFTLVKDPRSGEYRICGVDITAKDMK